MPALLEAEMPSGVPAESVAMPFTCQPPSARSTALFQSVPEVAAAAEGQS